MIDFKKFLGIGLSDIEFFRRKVGWRSFFPPYTYGSNDSVFGIPFYANPYYDENWFQLTVGTVYNFLKVVDDIYYWVKYRTTERNHIVNTGLKPNYYDTDVVMFHACFALLGRFVEKELGKSEIDAPDTSYKGYRLHCEGGTDEAAIDLWLWFKHDLPILEAEYWEDSKKFHSRYCPPARHDDDDCLEKIKDNKLNELIKIRNTLWT